MQITHAGNMGGVRSITQKVLHGMSAQRTVSIQEAVHMIDNQDLVICSEKFTCLSLRQGVMLQSEKDTKDRKDIVTKYRNRIKKYSHMSLDEYFYQVFCREVLKEKEDVTDCTKHMILLPVGQNCKPRIEDVCKYFVAYTGKRNHSSQHKKYAIQDLITR